MARGEISIRIEEVNWNDILNRDSRNELENFLKNKKDMQIEQYEEFDENGNVIEGKGWKDVVIDISKIPTKKFTEVKNAMPFFSIDNYLTMKDGLEGYFNAYDELNYFAYRYFHINKFYPNIYRFEKLNMKIFIRNLFKYCEVPDNSHIKVSFQNNNTCNITTLLIGFKQTLLLYIDGPEKGAIYYDPKDEKDKRSFLYTLLGLLRSVRRPKQTKNKIYIVYKNSHGFEKTGFNVNKRKMNLGENYNEGFEKMSEKIITGLNDKHKTNLVILSGLAGTGKTSYIRYLASKCKKNIIFISPDMVESITDPAFIPFLMNNNDSILIIEDAEPALKKRIEGGRSSAVSNVLNLTDGLLSDCLKISIVATFNTDEKNIDEALIRKGRLLMHYKFEKLCVEKSKALLKKLGYDVEVKEPMTLADIYFYGTDNNIKERSKIGFKHN